MKNKSLTLLFLSTIVSTLSFAELTNECKQGTRPVAYDYCITRVAGSTNPDVIYHFHGLTQDHLAWVKDSLGVQIEKIWEQDRFAAPTVVSISFGQWWLLAEKNTKPQSGLYE